MAAAELVARLRSGVRCEPPAVVVEWRAALSEFTDTGFDAEDGEDAAALCGDGFAREPVECPSWPRPWRDQYTIRAAS